MTETILHRNCSNCKNTFPLETFPFKNKSRNIRQSKCRDCMNEYNRHHYNLNKQDYLERNSRQRKRNRETIKEYKSNKPCKDCGQVFPFYVMEFDHRNPDDKLFNIGRVSAGNMNLIKDEIKKCDLLCANCHKSRTYNRWLKKNGRILAGSFG